MTVGDAGAFEERIRAPTTAALVTVIGALPALVVGFGLALLAGSQGLLPVDGAVSWVFSVLATAFVAYLANLLPVVAWAGLLGWVRSLRGPVAHDVVALATCPLALGISFGAAVLAGDAAQTGGLGVASALLAAAAIAAGRRTVDDPSEAR